MGGITSNLFSWHGEQHLCAIYGDFGFHGLLYLGLLRYYRLLSCAHYSLLSYQGHCNRQTFSIPKLYLLQSQVGVIAMEVFAAPADQRMPQIARSREDCIWSNSTCYSSAFEPSRLLCSQGIARMIGTGIEIHESPFGASDDCK